MSATILSRIHYTDAIMGMIASQITSLTIVYSTVYSDADQRKHQSSASLAFVRGIHRRPVNSPHKWPVTRKMFPFDDAIMFDVLSVAFQQLLSRDVPSRTPSAVYELWRGIPCRLWISCYGGEKRRTKDRKHQKLVVIWYTFTFDCWLPMNCHHDSIRYLNWRGQAVAWTTLRLQCVYDKLLRAWCLTYMRWSRKAIYAIRNALSASMYWNHISIKVRTNITWYKPYRRGWVGTQMPDCTHRRHPIFLASRSSYGVCIVMILEKIDQAITTPHCIHVNWDLKHENKLNTTKNTVEIRHWCVTTHRQTVFVPYICIE